MADTVDGVVYRAEAFLAVGQIDRAETLLRNELAQRPGDGALLLTLAKVFEERRQWPDVIDTATAALDANPNSLSARMMIAWAAYRLDRLDLMKEHVDVVLSHRPEHPTALMYLALHGVRDQSAPGKERTRTRYRQSLEHGGGDPWYTLMAAKIEVRLGRSSEARKLVDGGLEQHPMDASLLAFKADLSSTTVDESMDIVSGLLAGAPADPSLRARFDALVAQRRRGVLVMLWFAPALVAMGVVLTTGGFRTGWMIGVATASFTVWGIRNSTIEKLPPAYRAELASRAPWRIATRVAGRTSAALTFVGGILLAAGVVPAAWLLVLAALTWVVTRMASLAQEKRLAASADAELAVLRPGVVDRESGVGPSLNAVARGRWNRLFTTPFLLIPLCIPGLIPAGPADEGSAARAVIGVIAAIVGLTSVVEAASFRRRERGYPLVTAWRIVRLAVPTALLTTVLLVSLANLVSTTGAWTSGAPVTPVEQPSDPPTVPSDYFGDDETPVPLPSIDMPDFDLPSIPPLDPEG